LIKNRAAAVSSFDHSARYGGAEPIDAIGQLGRELAGQRIVAVAIDGITGDLHVDFAGEIRLEVFNFSAYEDWQLRFPDGGIEISNQALQAMGPMRRRPRTLNVLVGELLSLSIYAPACTEELADLVREDHRFNEWLLALKHGRAKLKADRSGEQLIEDSRILHETDFRLLLDACDAYRSALHVNGPDVWQQAQDRIRNAAVAYTRRISDLRADYGASE
jgi:hypothetical protein